MELLAVEQSLLDISFSKIMYLSNFEYIFLRLIRKFILRDRFLTRCEKWIPYYEPSQNESSPVPIVDLYWKYSLQKDINLIGKNILEIGSGTTNSTGYEIEGRGANYIGYEPYASFNEEQDDRIYQTEIANRFSNIDRNKVSRILKLSSLYENSIDIVFSHSVLEHVDNLDELLIGLKRVLKKRACMFHIVDYRDHFFKHPFHFLQFSKKVWNAFLNPGDLPRARITDHLHSFQNQGFSVEILERRMDKVAFHAVKKYIHDDFRRYTDDDLATTSVVLFVQDLQK